jgi:hypothetical protein
MSVSIQGGGGLPPIVRTANRLLVVTEEVVRRFPRYHKYTQMRDHRVFDHRIGERGQDGLQRS